MPTDAGPASEGIGHAATDEAAGMADATTQDAFLGGLLTIRQRKGGPRAGLDALFLAAACPARPGESVLEAGAGGGIVSLAVARRVGGLAVTGVEIDPGLAALGRANAAANGLGDAARFVEGDVCQPSSAFAALGLTPSRFDHALANPPFLIPGEARVPRDAVLARAYAAPLAEWDLWLRFLAAFTRPGGTVTLIHRADALPRLLDAIGGRFGGLVLFPLFARAGGPAIRLIIQGTKGSRRPLQMRPGMVLHRDDGGFTEEADAILRHARALTLDG